MPLQLQCLVGGDSSEGTEAASWGALAQPCLLLVPTAASWAGQLRIIVLQGQGTGCCQLSSTQGPASAPDLSARITP